MNNQLVETIAKLASIARVHGFDQIASRAEDISSRLNYSKVHIVVVGEFNRGKTTFVNALIGEPLLPMDIVPTTAAIWSIEKGDHVSSQIVRKDGSTSEVDFASLSRLSADGDLCAQDIKFVRLTVPTLAVGDDVVVIDTPGVNDINEQRSEITYGFLAQAEAAVFLLDASAPVTRSESEFLQGQVLDSHLDKILFVLNKSDRIDSDELEDACAAAEERLKELLGKEVSVIPLESVRVLSALADGNLQKADESGWSRLTNALGHLLESARSEASRIEMAQRRCEALQKELLSRIGARAGMISMGEQARFKANTELDMSEQELRGKLDRFKEHVRLHGRDRLKGILSQSLGEAQGEFSSSMLMRLESMKGDFSLFAGKVFPFELQIFMKRWFEGRQPQIEMFLNEFSTAISLEYSRHFGTVFGYVGGRLPLAKPVGNVSHSLHAEDPNDMVTMAMPAVGYLAASFLIGGPFVILGMVGGALFGKKLHDEKAMASRQQLIAELPAVVDAATSQMLEALLTSVDQWFEEMLSALSDNFDSDLALRRKDLNPGSNSSQVEAELIDAAETVSALRW